MTAAARRGVVAAFAFLSVYFLNSFPASPNSNELSHLQTVVSFVDTGTFAIDDSLEALGDHNDKSAGDGHFYSNKAPGLAFAAIPVYRLLRVVLPPPRTGTDGWAFFGTRLLAVSLLSLVALWRFGARAEEAGPPAAAPLLLFAVAFGTPFLLYGRVFFSHAWTAALLFLSWDLIRAGESRARARGSAVAPLLAAGFLASWAAISEYPAAILAALLGLRAAAGGWNRALAFAAGAVPPLALLLAYDAVCFGSPWVLSSAREAHPILSGLAARGLFGIGWPSARVAWAYLLDPARGLLLYSPFFLWAIPGFWKWYRSGRGRADCLLAAASTLLFFTLLTGYPNWHGGSSLGNRYLLPVIFFAALAAAYALETALSRGLFVVAVAFSSVNHAVAVASWPHFPAELAWPLSNASWWFLRHGWVTPNLGTLAGWPPWASLLAPAAAALAAWGLCLAALRMKPAQALLLSLLGGALHGALCLLAPPPSEEIRRWRAAFLETASGRAGPRRP